jgi:hypothetical protein
MQRHTFAAARSGAGDEDSISGVKGSKERASTAP